MIYVYISHFWCPLAFNELLMDWIWGYLQGSPRGYLLELKFYSVDLILVMVWSWSVHIPISLFQFFSVLGVFFVYVGWFFWWDISYLGFVLVATFNLPGIGICIS